MSWVAFLWPVYDRVLVYFHGLALSSVFLFRRLMFSSFDLRITVRFFKKILPNITDGVMGRVTLVELWRKN